MHPDQWQQIDQLFHAALALVPHERAAFVATASMGDAGLQHEVATLLAAHEQPGEIWAISASDLAADWFNEQPPEPTLSGQQISHYQIQSLLGQGGMGEVWRAHDSHLNRNVALKVLPVAFAQDTDRLRRFEQEARAISALNHPNIITIHEIGQQDDQHYIITEFIDGESLRQRLHSARLTASEAIDITLQIASALEAAHHAGIVHRDIKPENVMLRTDEYVKVLDFGLAKLTGARKADFGTRTEDAETLVQPPSANPQSTTPGMIMGTTSYMSPEQARGLGVDARSDIWSLGCVLYEMVTGRRAFEGATTSDIIAAILQNEPPPIEDSVPSLPAELEHIVRKALSKDQAVRYQSVKDMAPDLKRLKKQLELTTETEELKARTLAPATSRLAVSSVPSSAEYIVNNIKQSKFAALAALILLALAAAFFFFMRKPVLTDKDIILLADFQNTTGEAVFDGTLNQGLAVQLGQSPFLSLLPKARVQETLRLMGRGTEEMITPDIAREICQRQGIKSFINGSITALGKNYVLTLEAVNANTGAPIISEQNEAETKEQVLRTLGKTATSLREKLGESLPSIAKFDAPIEQATTSSLEALKAYSLAMEQYGKGVIDETVVSLYRRAIELDPNCALCYGSLARLQFNIGRTEEAVASATKAFELRERTSENEKLSIAVFYYKVVTLDLNKAIETGELWKRTYPRFWQPYHSLADLYYEATQYEKAVENGREAIRLNPNFAPAYTNPAGALVLLNRFAEAKEIYRQAMANHLEHIAYHFYLFWIAYFERDATAMQQQIDWLRTHDYEHWAVVLESQWAMLQGRWQQSLELARRARAEAEKRGEKNMGASIVVGNAHTAALFGACRTAKQRAAQVLTLSENNSLLSDAALTLALCGEDRQALRIADELAARFPKDPVLNELRLPTVRAAVELQRGRPAQALELLQATRRYEGDYLFFVPYLRGLALLRKGENAAAVAEFQSIRAHPGWFQWTPLVPLSHLWEAHAHALAGDPERSRQAYREFFTLWKDADADLPVLIEAKKEYEKIK